MPAEVIYAKIHRKLQIVWGLYPVIRLWNLRLDIFGLTITSHVPTACRPYTDYQTIR